MTPATIALDFATFGNGYGLSQPFFDGVYYWLVDMHNAPLSEHGPYPKRDQKRGRFYRASSGLGAQLHSTQWTHPRAGERRLLNGVEYVVFQSHRRWLRVEVSWQIAGLHRRKTLDEQHALIESVMAGLRKL